MRFDPEQVARALRKSWSPASARQWTAENPAAGQCNVTALLVYELFGGELLKTSLPEGDHFYNRIGGRRYDFTDSQFTQPMTYSDLGGNALMLSVELLEPSSQHLGRPSKVTAELPPRVISVRI
jgi:hypothetical protein